MTTRAEKYILQRRVVSFESDQPPEIVIERVRQKTIGDFQFGPSPEVKPLRGYVEGREFHGAVRFPSSFDFYARVHAKFIANENGTTVRLVVHGGMLLNIFGWLWVGLLLVFMANELVERGMTGKAFLIGGFALIVAFVSHTQIGNLDDATARTKETFASIIL